MKPKTKDGKQLMWTLEDWGMLLDHHLTEATSKRCMFYMGESILKLEKNKEMQSQIKACKVLETNEVALKDWTPLQERDLEKNCGKPTNGRSAVYYQIKGGDYKTIVTLSDAKYEIFVDSKGIEQLQFLYYTWELALLMDAVITYFIEGKSNSTKKERLTKAMELLSTLDDKGLRAIREACAQKGFARLLKNMCKGMKNPFIAKQNERSSLNRCVFFWRSDNGGEEAINQDKKMMISAIRAVAMGIEGYPLHVAIECNNLDAVVLLLANGVDPNAKNEKGVRPLYDALQNGYANIVKALLLFGADPKRDVARGISFQKAIHPDDKSKFEDILNIIDDEFEFEQVKFGEFEKRRYDKALESLEQALKEGADIQNLLSLDGGGIRGLVLIEIMDALEKKYGPALLDRFRWVAGTSTGAIMALALGQGKDVAECRRLYFRLKDLVFYRTTKLNPYPVGPLEKFLEREFEKETMMSSLDNGASKDPQKRKKNVMVTTADCSETTAKLRLFRNFNVPDQTKEENDEAMRMRVWEAARSSSAAPMYFPPMARKYVDGGIVANNPVLPLLRDFVACQESVALGLGSSPSAKPAKLGVVLSLGTGWKPLTKAKELQAPEITPSGCQGCAFDLFGLPGYLVDFKNTYGQMLKGLKNQILRSEASVNNARDWAFSMNGAFFRFNPSLEKSFALDETDNALLIDLMWKTRVYMRQQKAHVDMFVNILHKTTKESDGEQSMNTQSTQSSTRSVKKREIDENVPEYSFLDVPLTTDQLFVKSARDELDNDPKVRARVQFLENDKLELAWETEVYTKYLEYAREELDADPLFRARVQFLENDKLELAWETEVYTKYIEYAREEIEADPFAVSRARFLEDNKLPLAIETEDLPLPPSFDIPGIDTIDDFDDLGQPPKPPRMI